MIIDNLDIRDVAIGSDKTNTELIVDADRVLALAVPFERFKQHAPACKVGQSTSRIQRIKSSHGYPLDVAKSTANQQGLFVQRNTLYLKRERWPKR
jgi:hypothetical protein